MGAVKKFVYFLLIGLAVTALQVALVDAHYDGSEEGLIFHDVYHRDHGRGFIHGMGWNGGGDASVPCTLGWETVWTGRRCIVDKYGNDLSCTPNPPSQYCPPGWHKSERKRGAAGTVVCVGGSYESGGLFYCTAGEGCRRTIEELCAPGSKDVAPPPATKQSIKSVPCPPGWYDEGERHGGVPSGICASIVTGAPHCTAGEGCKRIIKERECVAQTGYKYCYRDTAGEWKRLSPR
jgi:hypothetical protein